MAPRVAYLMSRFPHLPETFILREMTELEQQGWQVALYPLILQEQPVVHAEAEPWLARARRLPFISSKILAENARSLLQQPHRYSQSAGQALWENSRSAKFFSRTVALFPKAVYAARQMQREGVNHIHAHYATHPALVAWLIHRLTGISYSITVHAHDIFVQRAMLATKLREATFIAAISHYNVDFLAHTIGPWVRDKTRIVRCGIVPDHYPLRHHLPTPGEPFEIISVGSLQPYKGHPVLLRACALLRDRGIPVRCRIIGEGQERPRLEQMIEELGLASHVSLLGAQPQEAVARLLPTAHCYVQPSIIEPSGKMEGIPVALMEALACALPVVATSISGIPELVRPGETGYLAPPADSLALANALAEIYQQPERADKLGRAGRELVRQEFELKSNVRRLSNLFNQVITARQPLGAAEPTTVLMES